jgi:hypothetical protein
MVRTLKRKPTSDRIRRHATIPAAAVAILMLFVPHLLHAAWPVNGQDVSGANGDDKSPAVAADGQGGVIVTWARLQDPSAGLVLAQRVSADGTILWRSGGINVHSGWGLKRYPSIMNDGVGGAIIAWEDGRDDVGYPDIYVQRIDLAGTTGWKLNGVAVCAAPYEQQSPRMVSDGSGGAIIVWSDRRSGKGYFDIYAQRVDRTGIARWAQNGIQVCAGVNIFTGQFDVVPDGVGGAIIAWQKRNWDRDEYSISAQRIDQNGNRQWTTNGVAVCSAAGEQIAPHIVRGSDGAVIVTWYDRRSGGADIYAQKISMAGVSQWAVNGACICSAPFDQRDPRIVATAGGGAMIVWQDRRNGNQDVYYQKVSAQGQPLWRAGGVPLCTQMAWQSLALLDNSGSLGALAVWYDERYPGFSILARRLEGDGSTPSYVDGVIVCATRVPNPNSSYEARCVSDGAGGAIVAWEDYRTGRSKIYVRRTTGQGNEGLAAADAPAASIALHQNYPNPFNPTTRIAFELEETSAVSLRIFSVDGTLVRELLRETTVEGSREVVWDGKDNAGRKVASGVYLYRLVAGSNSQTKKMVLLR